MWYSGDLLTCDYLNFLQHTMQSVIYSLNIEEKIRNTNFIVFNLIADLLKLLRCREILSQKSGIVYFNTP